MSAAVLLGNFVPLSPEWHAARSRGIGGSDVAAILGLSPWESRFSLWHRKAGLVGDQDEKPQMTWGKRLEPVICGAFADNHPELDLFGAGTFVNTERPWQIANVDRLIYSPDDSAGEPVSLLEVKTSRFGDGFGRDGTTEVPIYYRVQVMHYLDTLGLPFAHLAVLIGGSDYREYRIDYDEADATYIRGEAKAFLDSIVTGDRPPLDGSTATYDVVRQLPEGVDDTAVEIPPAVVVGYVDALKAKKAADTQARLHSATVLDLIGTAKKAVCAGEPIATRAVNSDGRTHSLRPAKGLTEEPPA